MANLYVTSSAPTAMTQLFSDDFATIGDWSGSVFDGKLSEGAPSNTNTGFTLDQTQPSRVTLDVEFDEGQGNGIFGVALADSSFNWYYRIQINWSVDADHVGTYDVYHPYPTIVQTGYCILENGQATIEVVDGVLIANVSGIECQAPLTPETNPTDIYLTLNNVVVDSITVEGTNT